MRSQRADRHMPLLGEVARVLRNAGKGLRVFGLSRRSLSAKAEEAAPPLQPVTRLFPRIGGIAARSSNDWKIVAALAFLVLVSASVAEDAAARKVRQKAERGVKGRILAIADDEFVIYLDGRKVASGDLSKTPEPKEVTLKPGDVIAVRAVNREGDCGFGLIFVSNSGKVVFSTNSGEWRAYTPPSDAKWWEVKRAAASAKPVLGSNATINHDIETLAAQGCDEIIWGDLAEDVAYLYRTITVEELIE